jgi:hypothetical protein
VTKGQEGGWRKEIRIERFCAERTVKEIGREETEK